MEKVNTIQLRLSTAATISPLFYAMQGDKDTRKIEAAILNDDGTAFTNETGMTAEYWSKKPDGTGTQHSATISSSSTYFKVNVTLTEQDLAAPGKVYATIVIKKSGNILATMPFWFMVVPIPIGEDVESESDYQTLRDATDAANNAASSANSAASSATSAASSANSAASSATSAASSANSAASSATSAASSANTAASNANDKASAANTAAGSANSAASSANTAAGSANSAASAANTAAAKANAAAGHGPYIDENTLYWYVWDEENQQYVNTYVVASGAAEGAVLYSQQTLTDAQQTQARTNIAAANSSDMEKIIEMVGARRYGVSGILNSSPTLTRLYDAVGLTAAVGTDTQTAVNDFDNRTPFNRRKCVGTWNLIDGKPVFQVNAYLGDPDYAEDGTMGDYVAVECPRAFYKIEGTELVISAHRYPGFRPFDIFCRNHDPEDAMEYYYRPAYALAVNSDGKAVCLPGYDNAQGDYKSLFDKARTYKNGALANFAILQRAAMNFYEWALYTVEFATNHCQSIMQGCSGLRHDNNDRVTFIDATHALIHNYQAARVAGECIAIISTSTDINSAAYQATHRIVSITRCDSEGNPSASGTYQLMELTDFNKGYFEYDLTGATEYRIAARPYRTGDCNSVLTPSGSPVSNSDSYHPMRYRYAENVFGNQYHTTVDLFNMRVGTGDNDYYLEWYYITDPTDVTTPKNWGASDLAAAPFTKLGVETDHAHYVSGYLKSKLYDAEFPDIWIPYETTGGSASTYFCDYAYLVNSHVVRSVRSSGIWANGSDDGFSNAHAYYAPSYGYASFGGDLCIDQ